MGEGSPIGSGTDGRALPTRPVPTRPLPTRPEAEALARELLSDQGTRLKHVRTAGRVAARLRSLFQDPADADLVVVAATLHDIGYSPRLRRTGFHPLDGGLFLRAEGYPERLARLVANHSMALLHAGPYRDQLAETFPPVEGLVADALAYSDMHSAPDGRLVLVEHRLTDIAARHADPLEDARAAQLRIAIARVGRALMAVSPGIPLQSASRPDLGAALPDLAAASRATDGLLPDLTAWWAGDAACSIEFPTVGESGMTLAPPPPPADRIR